MFARLRGPFVEFGLVAGLLYVVDQLLARLSPDLRLYVYELMVQPIHGAPLLRESMSKHLSIAEIHRGDALLDLLPAPPTVKEARFEQGAICFLVRHRNDPMGFIWLSPGRYEEDEARCRFLLHPAAESVFDFDLYVLPKHRLGLGFAGLWHSANELLYARGIRYTYSRLTRFNLPSRRAHAHLGWKRVASAVFFKAWSLQVMVATMRPFVHVSFSRSGRVDLHLKPDVLASDRLTAQAAPAKARGVSNAV